MGKVLQFFSTIIDGIVSMVTLLFDGVSYMTDIVMSLPAIVVGPIIAGLAILVVYAIIGRGS